MPTDTDKKLNGAPEPFRRPVVWGRPPATIFRAGPLPKGEGLPPLPQAPPMQFTPGILSGSMIPRAAPAGPQAQARAALPAVARAPEPREEAAPPLPAAAPRPDLTVRPLPAVEPEPAPAPEPVQPIVFAAEPAAAPVPAAGAVRKPASRVPLYAGIAVAAATVLALGGWIWTRPPSEAPVPAAIVAAPTPTPAVPVVEAILPESTPVPAPVTEAVVETPAPVVAPPAARPAATIPAPVRTPPPPAARPASPAPVAVAPQPTVTPPPVIVIAPDPAPTEAERPSTDPDGPMATRPQPVG